MAHGIRGRAGRRGERGAYCRAQGRRRADAGEFVRIRTDLDASLDEWEQLARALADPERCGRSAPAWTAVQETLQECQATLRALGGYEVQASTAETQPADQSEEGAVAEARPAQVTPGQAVAGREEAFRTLSSIAAFFRRTEPHSPVSYLLEQAVRWGRMPLDDLLDELIADEKARDSFRKLAGIRSEQAQAGSEAD